MGMENFSLESECLCNIRKNGAFDERGVCIKVQNYWTFDEFLKNAEQRMNADYRAIRAFDFYGIEVTDCMMIKDGDSLFLSNGEPFISPSSIEMKETMTNDEFGRTFCEQYSLPSVVGPFLVGELLGKGGFGEVRLGTNKLSGEKIALKFLRKSEMQCINAAARMSTEMQCLSILNHKNIIKMSVRLETPDYVVLAFDLMEEDMYQYLYKRGPLATDAALSEDEARMVFVQILAGVDCIHKNHIIHRDLKLENIFIKDGNLKDIKIGDFGLSQFCHPGEMMKTDGCGTISTVAPELLSSTSSVAGPPSDVWSIGVVLFTLLCGRLPFEGSSLSSMQPSDTVIKKKIMKGKYTLDDHLSREVEDLLSRILEMDPSKRATILEISVHPWITRCQLVFNENTYDSDDDSVFKNDGDNDDPYALTCPYDSENIPDSINFPSLQSEKEKNSNNFFENKKFCPISTNPENSPKSVFTESSIIKNRSSSLSKVRIYTYIYACIYEYMYLYA
jgi:serine/threonine protein kinase